MTASSSVLTLPGAQPHPDDAEQIFSSVLEKKVQALSCHQSQMRNIHNDPDAWVRRKAIVERLKHRYTNGEPFCHMIL